MTLKNYIQPHKRLEEPKDNGADVVFLDKTKIILAYA